MKRLILCGLVAASFAGNVSAQQMNFGGGGGSFGGGSFGGTGGFGSTGNFGGTGSTFGSSGMSGNAGNSMAGANGGLTTATPSQYFGLQNRFGTATAQSIGNSGGFGGGAGFGNGSSTTAGRLGGLGLNTANSNGSGIGGMAGRGGIGGTGIGGMGMGMGGMGMGMGMGGMGMNRMGMGGMGMNQMNRNGQQNNKNQIRARISPSFAAANAIRSAQSEVLEGRIKSVTLPGGNQDIQVLMQGRTAVLRGKVASEGDANLVARMLSLEPGVDDIVNELDFPERAAEAVAPVPVAEPQPIGN